MFRPMFLYPLLTYLLEFVKNLMTPTITPTTVIVMTAYRSVFHFCNEEVVRFSVFISILTGIKAVVNRAIPTIAQMTAMITLSKLDSDSMNIITSKDNT